MSHVLVVDDDGRMAEMMRRLLVDAGYDVRVASGGFQALEELRHHVPDVMLLDFRMPDLDGIDVLDELRQPDGSTPFPVIVFTSESGPRYGEAVGLRAGAVDYVRKGADALVILARVEAALRRFRATARSDRTREIVHGRLRIDARARRVTVDGRTVRLEARPYSVLLYLAERPDEVVPRTELLSEVWGTGYAGFGHAVDQAVYEIRRALGDRRWVETVARSGYRLGSPP